MTAKYTSKRLSVIYTVASAYIKQATYNIAESSPSQDKQTNYTYMAMPHSACDCQRYMSILHNLYNQNKQPILINIWLVLKARD